MNKLKGILVLFAMFAFLNGMAQEKVGEKVKTVKIQTSAICGMCKKRIEKELNYTKGIIFAELDVETAELTVKYKTKHISADDIRQILASIGYDADDVKKNEEAHAALPKCCRVKGECE